MTNGFSLADNDEVVDMDEQTRVDQESSEVIEEVATELPENEDDIDDESDDEPDSELTDKE